MRIGLDYHFETEMFMIFYITFCKNISSLCNRQFCKIRHALHLTLLERLSAASQLRTENLAAKTQRSRLVSAHFFLVFNVVSCRSRGEMAARVFEKQADIELRREEWREEVVKTKKRALEVTET